MVSDAGNNGMDKYGFSLVREEELREAGGRARLWRHNATGAELFSVCNGDENKVFGVSFRTPPKDSTGVAHILEHSVLCGSEKYPVKEPFAELLKSSLQTFLNALTFPDKTCYPVASCNLQDFHNLVDVYLDAVFHPRIDENVFRQEGWHIETDAPDGAWSFKGVVYNEMKGVYSSPESVLQEKCQQSVFPDMLYSLDSGGDPEVIPTLTFEDFRRFHAAYYHPSNARFFFWGDDEEDARLQKLEAVLQGYSARPVDSAVPLQPRLSLPRKVEVPYAASEEAGEDKAHAAVNWLLCETRDTEEMLVLEMLEHILSGLPGSPLNKALLDSGLGEDIAGCGLETELRQAYFSLGMFSMRSEDADAMERIMMETLADLAENGVPASSIEAALNSLEFTLRENHTGSCPRGLSAMFSSLSDWLYDGDPFAPLAWEKPLASIKRRLAAGEKIFEGAIRRWFLENPHRVLVVAVPQKGLAEARAERERQRLDALREGMTEAQRAETASAAQALRQAQQAADSQEALDTVPSLKRGDLPEKSAVVPSSLASISGLDVMTHPIDTMGIVYARMAFGLSAVPQRLLPLLPLYARALTEMGTERHDFVRLGEEIAARTGGMGASPVIAAHMGDGSPVAILNVASKCTAEKLQDMAAVMDEVLTAQDFADRERFAQMVLEEKARLEQSAIPSGNAFVRLRLGGSLSLVGRMNEEMLGVSAMDFMRGLERRVEEDWPSVREDLLLLHRLIVRRNDARLDITADAGLIDGAAKAMVGLAGRLPAREALREACDFAPLPQGELLSVPAQVNYVGLGFLLKDAGYRYSGAHAVVMRHLRMGYLWDRVRVQGGAYGCSASFSRATGAFIFSSYRDPNVARTLEAYRNCAEYLENVRLSEADLTRAVVGTIGDVDHYLLPGDRGAAAFSRWMTGFTDEERQRRREEILGARLSDFREFGSHLKEALRKAVPCVLGGADAEAFAKASGWTVKTIL